MKLDITLFENWHALVRFNVTLLFLSVIAPQKSCFMFLLRSWLTLLTWFLDMDWSFLQNDEALKTIIRKRSIILLLILWQPPSTISLSFLFNLHYVRNRLPRAGTILLIVLSQFFFSSFLKDINVNNWKSTKHIEL